MSKMSRSKGIRGELEFAALLRTKGFEPERGQQRAGGGDSPDVLTNIKRVHFEIKRTETISLYKAYGQAVEDSHGDQIPIVAHRRNNMPWLVVLSAADMLEIIRRCPDLFEVGSKDD